MAASLANVAVFAGGSTFVVLFTIIPNGAVPCNENCDLSQTLSIIRFIVFHHEPNFNDFHTIPIKDSTQYEKMEDGPGKRPMESR